MTSLQTLLRPILRLLVEIRGQRGLLVRSTLSMTVFQLATAAAAGLSTAAATSVVVDAGRGYVNALLLGLLAAIIAAGVFMWVESWLSHVLAYRVLDSLRMRVYDAVQWIVPARTGRRRAGEVTGTAMNDVELLEWFYAHTLGSGINAIVSPLIVSAVLVALVGPVGLIVPAGILLLLLIPWLFASAQVRQGAAIRRCLGELQAIALEGSAARRELATLGLTEHHRGQVLERTAAVQDAKRRFALRAAGESALADVVIAMTSLGFLVALITAAARGAVDPARIPAALVLVSAAVVPAAGAFAMVQRLGEMSAAARRILEIIDVPTGHPVGTANLPRGGHGRIVVAGVRLAYDEGPRVLDGLDLSIEPGEHVALVGASGAGKTTIARLLTGLWQPDEGCILLDGIDVASVDPTSLRREVALVSQQPFVFRGTVRSNLLLAAPDADDAALWTALDNAGLAETVAGWEHGLDERVGDRGATMSGGQRQRLSIAQVLLRDPAVLILDEASAHLDSVSESDLAAAVARLRRGRTTIVIAHRVSTIRRAARVILLDEGRVAADGTHDELLAESSSYRALTAHGEARTEVHSGSSR